MSSEIDRKTLILAMWCHLLVLPGQIIIFPLSFFLTSTILFLIFPLGRSLHDEILVLSAVIMPFVNFCLSTVVTTTFWKINQYRDPFIDESGKESVNFWLSSTLYLFALDVITLASCGIPYFKNLPLSPALETPEPINSELLILAMGVCLNLIATSVLMLFILPLIIIASIHTAKGRMYRYPSIVRFLK